MHTGQNLLQGTPGQVKMKNLYEFFQKKLGFLHEETQERPKWIVMYGCHGSQNICGALFKFERLLCCFAAAPAALGMV